MTHLGYNIFPNLYHSTSRAIIVVYCLRENMFRNFELLDTVNSPCLGIEPDTIPAPRTGYR